MTIIRTLTWLQELCWCESRIWSGIVTNYTANSIPYTYVC